jgi:hypothetical protein
MKYTLRYICILILMTSLCYGATVELEGGSSAIAKVVYVTDSTDGTFYVYFTSNPSKAYTFVGMTMEVFVAWRDAPSRGQYYNEYHCCPIISLETTTVCRSEPLDSPVFRTKTANLPAFSRNTSGSEPARFPRG